MFPYLDEGETQRTATLSSRKAEAAGPDRRLSAQSKPWVPPDRHSSAAMGSSAGRMLGRTDSPPKRNNPKSAVDLARLRQHERISLHRIALRRAGCWSAAALLRRLIIGQLSCRSSIFLLVVRRGRKAVKRRGAKRSMNGSLLFRWRVTEAHPHHYGCEMNEIPSTLSGRKMEVNPEIQK
jgi:hypothetical protein